MITLKTEYGVDVELDFRTHEVIERFRADVELSDGPHHVVLEVHYNA